MPGPALRCDALVLGRIDYGERDRIVRLLTPEHGRLSALARGARGSRRRFQGALDLGNRVRVILRRGRGELWHLQEADIANPRLSLREALLPMGLAAYACELVGAFAREQHAEPRLFGLLEVFLTVLDGATEPPCSAFRAGLEVKALTCAGFAPILVRCARCGELLEGACSFSAEAGGGLHQHCGSGEPLRAEFLFALEHARRTRLIELLDLALPSGPTWLLARFAEHQLQRGLASRKWLESLE